NAAEKATQSPHLDFVDRKAFHQALAAAARQAVDAEESRRQENLEPKRQAQSENVRRTEPLDTISAPAASPKQDHQPVAAAPQAEEEQRTSGPPQKSPGEESVSPRPTSRAANFYQTLEDAHHRGQTELEFRRTAREVTGRVTPPDKGGEAGRTPPANS